MRQWCALDASTSTSQTDPTWTRTTTELGMSSPGEDGAGDREID